jgi:hypothetical protein
MFIDWSRRKRIEIEGQYSRPAYVKFLLILVPLLIAIVFFMMYQSANPLFYDLTKDINLDFISFGWIFFTFLGLILCYGFFYNRDLMGLAAAESRIPMYLSESHATRSTPLNRLMRRDNEYLSGVILLVLLNLLLLLLNSVDLHYLWFDGQLPAGIKHKEFVHNGVGTLISSVVIAIIIILFYFRGALNYYEKSKTLRVLACIWIFQNCFMIFSTAYRNNLYIMESGLSYKKIGLYVYLLLTVFGLLTTFVKVMKLRTNWFLFRSNAALYYYVLVLAAIPNWDVIITDFNISKFREEKKALEKYLILDLSFKNLPQLYQLPEEEAAKDDLKARDYYFSLRGTYFNSFVEGRDQKLYEFLRDMETLEWQSACLEKNRVLRDLIAMKEKITSYRNNYGFGLSLSALSPLSSLSQVNISNSSGFKVNDLKYFPSLTELQMSNCLLTDINDLPLLPSLRLLDLSGNNISDIRALGRCPSIEVLNIRSNIAVKDFSPLLKLKKLKVLYIGKITAEGYQRMIKTFPGVQIQAEILN